MNRIKKLPRRLAALGLVLALCIPAAAAYSPYYGTPSAWAEAEVDRAEAEGFFQSSLAANFQGEITRREFASLAVLLYRKLGGADSGEHPQSPFTDVDRWDQRDQTAIGAAYDLGLMSGVSATAFAPDRPITRLEICVLLGRVLDKAGVALPITEPDEAARLVSGAEGEVPAWAVDGMSTVVGTGIMTGSGAGYGLGGTTSREQALLLCLRVTDAWKAQVDETAFTAGELARISELRALKQSVGTPHFTGESPYTAQPSTTGSLNPGALQTGFLDDGLGVLNYCRAIAGLPADVTCSAEKNRTAQTGALLLDLGEFSHTPGRPAGMDESLYETGYSATSTANIGAGHDSLFAFNLSCMDDSDRSNMHGVGHRRWLLSPNLKVVGMGYVGKSSATMVLDESRSPAISPDLVCWPAQGVFPAELADARLIWSCTPDPARYDLNGSGDITVTVTRERDGKVFSLDNSMGGSAESGPFLEVSTVAYGGGPAVLFRPGAEGFVHGDTLHVVIGGVRLQSGGTTSIEYTVKFYT